MPLDCTSFGNIWQLGPAGDISVGREVYAICGGTDLDWIDFIGSPVSDWMKVWPALQHMEYSAVQLQYLQDAAKHQMKSKCHNFQQPSLVPTTHAVDTTRVPRECIPVTTFPRRPVGVPSQEQFQRCLQEVHEIRCLPITHDGDKDVLKTVERALCILSRCPRSMLDPCRLPPS